jgi:hypothetical protein
VYTKFFLGVYYFQKRWKNGKNPEKKGKLVILQRKRPFCYFFLEAVMVCAEQILCKLFHYQA